MILLKTLLFTLLVPGTVAGLAPWLLNRAEPAAWRLPALPSALGAAVLAAGAALYLWCAWSFVAEGRGTPAPVDPPKQLVRGGIYRFSRNPMYLGVLGVLLGEALLWNSPLVLGYATAMAAAFHLRVLRYEEPVLARAHGAAYAEYRRRVPRWLGRPRG